MSDYITSILIWVIAVFGTAFIIVFSTIMRPFREKVKDTKFIGKLVTCILCVSWWIGAFYSVIYWSPSQFILLREQGFPHNFVNTIIDAFFGAASSWLIYLWISPRMVGK
jgi:hypothetical protein